MEKLAFDFELSEEAKAKKQTWITNLLQDERVLSFLKEHQLDAAFVEQHSGTFQQWIQTKNICANCAGLAFCQFQPAGHYLDLSYDGVLMYGSKPCTYYKDERLANRHEKYYDVMDFSRTDLHIDLTTLPLHGETKEYRDVVLHVISHLQKENLSRGIYLSGPPGVGKTYLCIGITNYFARQKKHCAFVNVAHLVSSLKRLFQDNEAMESLLAKIVHADVVVFDDIGGESVTAWSRDDILLPLLDARMNAHRLTYFTSNYTMQELQDRYRASATKNSEPVAALRLLERVKALSEEKNLKGRSRR